jgi:hypothetical protein
MSNATATATATTTATTTNISTEVISFQALSLLKGKGVTALEKADRHLANGAHIGALIANGVTRKALIDSLSEQGMRDTAHKLSTGNIRPAAALVAAKSGKAVTLMEVNGKAPYSEWLRMGAVLAAMPQSTNAGKPTAASKALALHTQLTEAATALRAVRG